MMNCPHCDNELKLNTLIDLAREILAKVSHCPNNGIKEVFDKEFHREMDGHGNYIRAGIFNQADTITSGDAT
jgi:hypothetical protein